jgi:uncharacterized protein YndB with AHSA1/START domain
MTLETDTILRLVCPLQASPQRVFEAWTDRPQWEQWLGSAAMRCDVPLLEPHVGGRFKITMHPANGAATRLDGEYKLFDRSRALGFSWWVEGSSVRTTLITAHFQPVGDETELRLVHEGLTSIASRDAHGKSWEESFTKLKVYLARGR